MEELPFFPPALLDGGGNVALIEHGHNDVCSSLVVVPVALAVLVMSLVAWSDVLGAGWLMALPNLRAGVQNTTIVRRKRPLFHHRYPGTSVSVGPIIALYEANTCPNPIVAKTRGPIFALYEEDTCRNPIMANVALVVLTINLVSSSQLLGVWGYIVLPNSEAVFQKNSIARMDSHRYAAAPICPCRFALSEDDGNAVVVPLALAVLAINLFTSFQLLGASCYMEHLNSEASIQKKNLLRVNGLRGFDPYSGIPLHGRITSALFVDETKVHRHFPAKVHVALGLLALSLLALALLLGSSIARPGLSLFHLVTTAERSHHMRAAPSPGVQKLRTPAHTRRR